ncbi:MAG: M20/M25/M40 family metallo-hydrolase [Pseudomonadota bacterium]
MLKFVTALMLVFVALGCSKGCVSAGPAPNAETERAFASSEQKPVEPRTAAIRIRDDVNWLADDAREGRRTGTRGYRKAATYVADALAEMGASPGAKNNAWFQEIEFRAHRRNLARARLTVTHEDEPAETYTHFEDFLIGRNSAAEHFEVSAPTVFVGFGIDNDRVQINDYEGIDANGKIAVMFTGAPEGLNSEERAYLASMRTKIETAANHGVIGIIFVRTEDARIRFGWALAIRQPSRESLTWLGPDGKPGNAGSLVHATATLSYNGAEKFFRGALKSFDEVSASAAEVPYRSSSFDLGSHVLLKGGAIFTSSRSPNVIGIIEGADPVLKDEIVLLTAHLDHIGIDPPSPENPNTDRINNGAMDNAIGVAIMLEVARSFKAMRHPPRRTIMIAALTAEEQGLLGAGYLAAHPPFEDKRIVANLNLDMPIILAPFKQVVAFGAERSTIGKAVEAAAAGLGLELIEDPVPEQGLFTRSDHYQFVRKGIPSAFMFLGFEDGDPTIFNDFINSHYHRPSDEPSLPIDYEAAELFSVLNFEIAKSLANAEVRPVWRKGDFFGETFEGPMAAD